MPLLLLTDHTSRNLLLNCKITALIFDWLDKPQQHKIKSGHLSSMHMASGQVSFFWRRCRDSNPSDPLGPYRISSATSSTSLSTSPYDTFYSLYIIAKVLKAVNRCGGKSAKTLPCFPLSPLDSGRSLHYNNADSFFTFETAIFRRFHSF